MFGSSQFDYLGIDVKFAFYSTIGLFIFEWLRPKIKPHFLRIPTFVKWSLLGLGFFLLLIFNSNSVTTFIFYRI